jgi:outer membrane murein-binding lipoprotein Lpp
MEQKSKPSTAREFWKGCRRQFWKWYGLDDVGQDVETHGAAVKKGAALRFLVVVIMATGIFVFEIRGCVNDGAIQTLNGTVTNLNTQITNLNSDKNTLQALYNSDENALGPLRKIANEKYAASPPDKRVDLLLQQIKEIDSKLALVSPLNQPITTATADVTIYYKGTGILPILGGDREACAFITGDTAILVANVPTGIAIMGDSSFSDTQFLDDSSLYFGKPITSLKDANYILIKFGVDNVTILGGQIKWTINSNTILKFNIPPQTSVGPNIVIRDLTEGLKPLSSIPDTSASPR